jgi:hypothetical protein
VGCREIGGLLDGSHRWTKPSRIPFRNLSLLCWSAACDVVRAGIASIRGTGPPVDWAPLGACSQSWRLRMSSGITEE